MRIGIDASRAFTSQKTGTEEYSYRLIKHLALMDLSGHQIFLYVKRGAKIDSKLPSNFFSKEIGGDFLWTEFHLSWEMLKNGVDVLFIPSHVVPLIHPAKSVVTIHGIEYRAFPGCYSLRARLALEIFTRTSITLAKKVIVPSECTKQDLMKFYGLKPEKITVVYHGVEHREKRGRDTGDKDFNILFIGRIEKRKNVSGIVRAFDKFMDGISDSDRKIIKLTLAGKNGFGHEEIEAEIMNSKYREHIELKGYVSEEEKRELYESAGIFLFPSFYEGFGIPVLEAMSFGVPVICSDVPALREVAGDAAVLIDPDDVGSISAAIVKVYEDKDFTQELTKKGYENLKRFSWDKCAKEIWEAISIF